MTRTFSFLLARMAVQASSSKHSFASSTVYGLFIPPDRGVFLVEVVLFGVVVDGVEHVKIPVLEVFPPFGQGWALIDFLCIRHGGLL